MWRLQVFTATFRCGLQTMSSSISFAVSRPTIGMQTALASSRLPPVSARASRDCPSPRLSRASCPSFHPGSRHGWDRTTFCISPRLGGARRVVFWRGTRSVVVLRGDVSRKSFWLVDLQTGAERQLGELTPEPAIGDFDVSRSADEIVFDRVEKNSEIALIERAHSGGAMVGSRK